MVLNPGPQDWESSALTTRSLNKNGIVINHNGKVINVKANIKDTMKGLKLKCSTYLLNQEILKQKKDPRNEPITAYDQHFITIIHSHTHSYINVIT